MILSRRVNPRASRIADMVASVPELHIRTFSTDGKARSRFGCFFDGVNNSWMRMAENSWSPRANVIDVFVSIDVIHPRAPGPVDKEWFSAHSAKRPHRGIHSARNVFQSFGEELMRASM